MTTIQLDKRTTPFKSVQYECEDCGIIFCLLDSMAICPSCGSRDLSHMVIVYKEDDPELAEMYTSVDWQAGD